MYAYSGRMFTSRHWWNPNVTPHTSSNLPHFQAERSADSILFSHTWAEVYSCNVPNRFPRESTLGKKHLHASFRHTTHTHAHDHSQYPYVHISTFFPFSSSIQVHLETFNISATFCLQWHNVYPQRHNNLTENWFCIVT